MIAGRPTELAATAGLLVFLLGGATNARGEERRLTVDDAVRMALAENPRILAATHRARANQRLSLSVGAGLLPSIDIAEEYQHYDSPYAIAAPLGADGMMSVAPATIIRKQDINTFSVTARQPVVGLLHRSQEYVSQVEAAKAASADAAAVRSAIREQVQVAFLQYFEARALEEIARASQAQLSEQLLVARQKLDAGVLTRSDVLRVDVAAANAEQQRAFAFSDGEAARARLFAAIGLDPGAQEIEMIEPVELIDQDGRLPGYVEGRATALRSRPELLRLRHTAASLRATGRARWFSLLPEVDAEGGYLRTDGQTFQPPNAAYVGVRATWPVWQWGATLFAAEAATQFAEAASFDLDDERRAVTAEVATELSRVRAVVVSVRVAARAIVSAEEAFRVTRMQLDAGTATTTDLLDSQAALVTAKLNLARARYGRAIELATLSRILGE
jgi:outer membrane protein